MLGTELYVNFEAVSYLCNPLGLETMSVSSAIWRNNVELNPNYAAEPGGTKLKLEEGELTELLLK